MGKMTAVDAETRAREFIRDRHPRAEGVRLTRTWREGDIWVVEGEFRFKRAHLFMVRRRFRLQIDTETGEVTSYEEARHFAR